MLDVWRLNRNDIQYLVDKLFDREGQLRVLPYTELRDVPQEHLSQLCVERGLYCVPTQELIDYLRAEIGDRKAIEIGAAPSSLMVMREIHKSLCVTQQNCGLNIGNFVR